MDFKCVLFVILVAVVIIHGEDDNLFEEHNSAGPLDVYNILNVQSMQLKYLSDRIERQEKIISQLQAAKTTRNIDEIQTRGGAYADLSNAEGKCNVTMRDCLDLYLYGCRLNGVYPIEPLIDGKYIRVYCDMTLNGGGWTVIQRRIDATVDFNRDLEVYKRGFGDLKGNMWLGLEAIHSLTYTDNNEVTELYVYMEDRGGLPKYAKYSNFSIANHLDLYRLHVTGYYGTAGDKLARHDGKQFSAYDYDVDTHKSFNCAKGSSGGWWFADCYNSCLNAPFGTSHFHWSGLSNPLSTSIMKIRRHV